MVLNWECKSCGKKLNNIVLPITCSCGGSYGKKDFNPKPITLPPEIGPAIWAALHYYKFTTPEDARYFLDNWMLTVPSYGCSCKAHWAAVLVNLPPDFSSAQNFFKWGVDAHNMVNAKLSKPHFSYKDALVKYDQNLRID